MAPSMCARKGVEPMALLSVLARIGTSQPVEPVASLDDLASGFDFAHFGRAPAHFDPHDVELINARLLHQLDFARSPTACRTARREADWLLLRRNLERLSRFCRLVRGPPRRDRAARTRP